MSGRSGYVVPAEALLVPPKWAQFIAAMCRDAADHFHGGAPPPDLIAWLADLDDYGQRVGPVPIPEPSVWVDVPSAASMMADAGVPLSERYIRTLAKAGALRSRRDGHRWQIAYDDLEEEIEARRNYRVPPGRRAVADSSQSHLSAVDHLEATA